MGAVSRPELRIRRLCRGSGRAVFGFSLSELILVGTILVLVLASGRMGSLGEAIASVGIPKKPAADPRIDVREKDEA